MKKLNKKAFTLVEILGVVVILSILLLLITAGILGYFSKGKDDYNDKLKGQLVLAGKSYYAEHKEELPTEANKKAYNYVTLPSMQSGNYITKSFIDSEGRECSPSYVFVKQKETNKSEYDFIPCLICQDKDGNQIDYSKNDSKYCDPKNWSQGIDDDEDSSDDNTCLYTKSGSTVTITNVTMPKGILRLYYIDSASAEHLIWPLDGNNSQTIATNITTDLPEGAKIYAEDNNNTKIECGELENEPTSDDPTPEGPTPDDPTPTSVVPVCTIPVPAIQWINKQVELTAECHSPNNSNIEVKNINNITVSGGKGSIVDRQAIQTNNYTITFKIKYKPNVKVEGSDTLKIGSGTVKNTNDSKINEAVSRTLKVDTVAPVIKYNATGTIIKATAKKDKKKGYKNKVTVTISCRDTGSGVSSFKQKTNNGSYYNVSNPYTTTKTARGTYTIYSSCVDQAGNGSTGKATYRVLNNSSSCTKCGVKKKKCTKRTSYYSLKWYCKGRDGKSGYSGSCSRVGQTYYNSGAQCECRKVSSGSVCTKWKCTQGKSCWY